MSKNKHLFVTVSLMSATFACTIAALNFKWMLEMIFANDLGAAFINLALMCFVGGAAFMTFGAAVDELAPKELSE